MWYVIVGVVCLIVGGCFGLLTAALCVAADEDGGLNIEYRTWPGKDE